MKKELLIIGSEGGLGKGLTKVLCSKDFDKVYLFASNFENSLTSDKVEQIKIKNLSKEENVINAFSNIKPNKEKLFFMYSTIGGFYGGQTLWETKLEDWERMLSINVTTSFLLAKHFSWVVKLSAGGSICFTTAYIAENPEPMKAIYGASKAALVHLIKTLSKESSNINLSVNGMAPYIIDTKANRDWMPEANFDKWIKPEEIGELAYSIFTNFNYVSGNIFTLKDRFNI